MKYAIIAVLYAIAFLAIFAAMEIAPNMTWPANGVEVTAAALLSIGCIAKCIATAALFNAANR